MRSTDFLPYPSPNDVTEVKRTRMQVIKEVKSFFRAVDSDGNKALSPDEMIVFLEAELELELDECLDNGDDIATRALCCADTGMTAGMREVCLDAETLDGMGQVFNYLDTDQSGDLSRKGLLQRSYRWKLVNWDAPQRNDCFFLFQKLSGQSKPCSET